MRAGARLTELAAEYEVNRKTIRRRLDARIFLTCASVSLAFAGTASGLREAGEARLRVICFSSARLAVVRSPSAHSRRTPAHGHGERRDPPAFKCPRGESSPAQALIY